MEPKKCVECDRPARKRGLCQMHYKRLQRRGQSAGHGAVDESLVPSARPSRSTPSDQGVVPRFSDLSQVDGVAVENGRLRRGDEEEEFGIACPDC